MRPEMKKSGNALLYFNFFVYNMNTEQYRTMNEGKNMISHYRGILRPLGGMLAAFMLLSPFGIHKAAEPETPPEETGIIEETRDEAGGCFPGIVCWGDSLTVGACGDGVDYPAVLRERISEISEDTCIEVINCGVGGESSATVATRSGAYDLHAQAFTIPAGCEPVPLKFYSDVKQITYPVLQGNGDFNPVTVAGIEGNLTASYDGVLARTTYTFTRTSPGEETAVEKGEIIIPYVKDKYSDCMDVVFIGTNGGFRTPSQLTEQIDAILSRNGKSADKYIVIGIFTFSQQAELRPTCEKLDEINGSLAEKYGDRFIDLRSYLMTDGLADAGLDETDADRERINEGFVPSGLLADDMLHLNAAGYTLLGNLVFEKMDSLGYFDCLKEFSE